MAFKNFDVPATGISGDKTKVVIGAGAAIGGNAVRIVVDDSIVLNKVDARNAVNAALARMLEGNWPPA